MTVDVALLLELIQHYPFIYDKSKRDFKDTNKKNNAWTEIAATLDCEVEEIKTRWRTLRERFTKETRNHEWNTRSGYSQEDTLLEWEWYDAMSFLESHIKCRKTTSSIVARHTGLDLDATQLEIVDLGSPGSSTASTSSKLDEADVTFTTGNKRPQKVMNNSEEITPRKQQKRNTKSAMDEIDTEVLKTLKGLESSQKEEDEDDLFGKVVACELRKITDVAEKQQLKAKIYLMATGLIQE